MEVALAEAGHGGEVVEGATMGWKTSAYDAYADEYAAYVAWREEAGEEDPMGILPHLLGLLGDLADRAVLDAGCGEGYLSRMLAARGARVTGVDSSPRLIAQARARDPQATITYHVADLSEPLPGEIGPFDATASYMVLNDVEDYQGFAATLAATLVPQGRLVLAFNSPYGWVVRKKVPDYFATGSVYRSGLGRTTALYGWTLSPPAMARTLWL